MSFDPRFTVSNQIAADQTRIERDARVLRFRDALPGLDPSDEPSYDEL